MQFTRSAGGDLHLTREGGHSARRIVHAAGEPCGWLLPAAWRAFSLPPLPWLQPGQPHLFELPLLSPISKSASDVDHTISTPSADATGAEIERALVATARANPSIQFFEHHLATDLLSEWRGCFAKASRVHLLLLLLLVCCSCLFAAAAAACLPPTHSYPMAPPHPLERAPLPLQARRWAACATAWAPTCWTSSRCA